jgi:hypothetical protein
MTSNTPGLKRLPMAVQAEMQHKEFIIFELLTKILNISSSSSSSV